MFSLRVCLAGLAVALLASPAAASIAVKDGSSVILRRGVIADRDLAAPGALLQTRESRRDAAARVKLAKKRAARKAKRDAASSDLEKRKAFTGTASTAAFATYLGTKCSRDKYCVNAEVAADLPTNGAAVCDLTTRHCVISCATGYILQSDGTCMEGATSCGTLTHGVYTIVNGVCTPQCSTNLGYLLTFSSGSGTPRCTNVATSTTNCGAIGVVCPTSYNGSGTTQCTNGMCNLRCPQSLFLYYTASGLPYCS